MHAMCAKFLTQMIGRSFGSVSACSAHQVSTSLPDTLSTVQITASTPPAIKDRGVTPIEQSLLRNSQGVHVRASSTSKHVGHVRWP